VSCPQFPAGYRDIRIIGNVKKNSSPELPIISIALPIPGDKRDGFSSTEAPGRRAPWLGGSILDV
jgi:hypothetical protein